MSKMEVVLPSAAWHVINTITTACDELRHRGVAIGMVGNSVPRRITIRDTVQKGYDGAKVIDLWYPACGYIRAVVGMFDDENRWRILSVRLRCGGARKVDLNLDAGGVFTLWTVAECRQNDIWPVPLWEADSECAAIAEGLKELLLLRPQVEGPVEDFVEIDEEAL